MHYQQSSVTSINFERKVVVKPRKLNNTSYKYLLAYCKETSLHGLPYVGNPEISFGERACWLLCFCIAVISAGYFVSGIYVNYDASPTIVTPNPLPMSITEIPFPALAVCSLNRVKRSFGEHVESHGNNLEKSFLLDFCMQSIDLNRTKVANSGNATNWQAFLNFILKASPSCSEMIKACFWKYVEIDCAKWFNPILTDMGLCCTFNQMPNSYIFRSVDIFNELSYTYPPLVEDWSQEKGYDEGVPDDVFPWRSVGAGNSLGLSVVLDCSLDEYYCSAAISAGFQTLLYNPLEVPSMLDVGRTYVPGKEVWVEILPEVTETTPDLQSLPVEKRFCYFENEKYLEFYRLYTQRNCIMECQTNYTLKMCNCVPFFLPRTITNRVCVYKDKDCAKAAEVSMTTQERTDRGMCRCLPGCFDLSFNKISHEAPLHKTTIMKQFYKDIPMDYFVKNCIIVHYYYYSPLLTKYIKRRLYGFSEFLSNTGGLLGLFLGFSVLSAVELGYYLSLRIFCFLSRWKENKRLQDSRGEESDVIIIPFVN